MRPVPPVAHRQFEVFTTEQALAHEWTSHALRHAVGTEELARLRPGVYTRTDNYPGDRFAAAVEHLRRRAAGVALTNPRVPVSHAGAAALLGAALPQLPEQVCATYPRGYRGHIADVHLHRASFGAGDVVRLQRILLTSAARTVVDLGREHGRDAAVVAGDSALRLGLTNPGQLADVVAHCRNWAGARAAQRAVDLLDPAAESVLESLSRVRMSTAGLPRPCTQAEITDAGGRLCGRCDFYWPQFGVVGEADGLAKYAGDIAELRREKLRQGALEDLGLIVVRWGWADLAPFAPTAERLQAAFARGSRPDRAPRLWRVRASAARSRSPSGAAWSPPGAVS